MTLVTLPGLILWPGILGSQNNAIGIGTAQTLTSAGHYVSFICAAKEDMTISHVGFRCGTSVGSPVMEVRIETVDASGLPSGTLWDSPTNTTNASTGTLSSNTYSLTALTAAATITKGQIFCVKLLFSSGTSQIIQQFGSGTVGVMNSNLPYLVNNTGTPTKAILSNNTPSIALGSSSTTFYFVPGTMPISANVGGSFNNTNSARRGLRFTIPFDCRAIGIRWFNTSAVGNYNAILFDDSGTELSSSSISNDGDHTAASSGGMMHAFFDNTVTLAAGSTYRIAIEPSSATNVNVSGWQLPSANYRGATMAGAAAHYTTYASAVWTDTATDSLPFMDLMIDQIDDGTGTGGGGGGQRVFSG